MFVCADCGMRGENKESLFGSTICFACESWDFNEACIIEDLKIHRKRIEECCFFNASQYSLIHICFIPHPDTSAEIRSILKNYYSISKLAPESCLFLVKLNAVNELNFMGYIQVKHVEETVVGNKTWRSFPKQYIINTKSPLHILQSMFPKVASFDSVKIENCSAYSEIKTKHINHIKKKQKWTDRIIYKTYSAKQRHYNRLKNQYKKTALIQRVYNPDCMFLLDVLFKTITNKKGKKQKTEILCTMHRVCFFDTHSLQFLFDTCEGNEIWQKLPASRLPFTEGQSVRAWWKKGDILFNATIKSVNADRCSYTIQFEDGDIDTDCHESEIVWSHKDDLKYGVQYLRENGEYVHKTLTNELVQLKMKYDWEMNAHIRTINNLMTDIQNLVNFNTHENTQSVLQSESNPHTQQKNKENEDKQYDEMKNKTKEHQYDEDDQFIMLSKSVC